MTKAIDFIATDIGKARGQGSRAAAIAAIVVGFSVALALGVRPNLEDLDTFYIVQSSLLGAVLFVFIWLYLSSRLAPTQRSLLWRLAVGVGLALSLVHEGAHPFTSHGSLVRFWTDAGSCIAKGVFTGLVSGTLLTFAVFHLLPMPDRRWQLGVAAAASFSGLVMLNLHCPSTVLAHIVFGHWAHGILVTVVISYWQGALFRHKLRQVVGETAAGSGAMDSLED